jgi:hypothetical protein
LAKTGTSASPSTRAMRSQTSVNCTGFFSLPFQRLKSNSMLVSATKTSELYPTSIRYSSYGTSNEFPRECACTPVAQKATLIITTAKRLL